MSRPLILLSLLPLLASCGVFGPSSEEAERLARYQSNAQIYWEGRDLGRALDQVRRGLQIDPYDYKLNLIRAWCLWRQSQYRPELLDTADQQFRMVLDLRGDDTQSARALLGAALVDQGIGQRAAARAAQVRERIARKNPEGQERLDQEAEALEHENESKRRFATALERLGKLVERGDLLRHAHYHSMQIHALRRDFDSVVASGDQYLDRVKREQQLERERLEGTLQPDYERQKRRRLQELIDQEVEVLTYLANAHFQRKNYGEAKGKLDAVLQRQPNRFAEYYNRARCHVALGNRADAKRDFEKFVTMTDLPRDHPQVAEALAALRQL